MSGLRDASPTDVFFSGRHSNGYRWASLTKEWNVLRKNNWPQKHHQRWSRRRWKEGWFRRENFQKAFGNTDEWRRLSGVDYNIFSEKINSVATILCVSNTLGNFTLTFTNRHAFSPSLKHFPSSIFRALWSAQITQPCNSIPAGDYLIRIFLR